MSWCVFVCSLATEIPVLHFVGIVMSGIESYYFLLMQMTFFCMRDMSLPSSLTFCSFDFHIIANVIFKRLIISA